MTNFPASWRNTTHDWTATVDTDHLARIRSSPDEFAPGGVTHLILEVIAYAADEAESTGAGRCEVTLHRDSSVSVADNGRGTDTRLDEHGQVVKKPIMATKDLRFFDQPHAERLPDGRPRRGISVVAALSDWLVHTNRRDNGAWSQRYEHGLPVTDLIPVADDKTTGTTVHFQPDPAIRRADQVSAMEVSRLCREAWPHLIVEIRDDRHI